MTLETSKRESYQDYDNFRRLTVMVFGEGGYKVTIWKKGVKFKPSLDLNTNTHICIYHNEM